MQGKLKVQRVVRSRLAEFEKRLNEGWTQQMLVDDLATEGIEVTVKYFGHCLNKARQAKKNERVGGGGVVSQEVPSPAVKKAEPAATRPVSEKGKTEGGKPSGEFRLVNLPDEDLF